MENTQKKVYAKYTFTSISLALALLFVLTLIFFIEPYGFIDIAYTYLFFIGISIFYCILSLTGIILVIRAYRYIYNSKKKGVSVQGTFLVSVAAIILVPVFVFSTFSTYDLIRMKIDPCYKPAPNVDCWPVPVLPSR